MTPAELARDRESVGHIQRSADRLAELAAAGRDAFDASWVQRSAARWEVQVIGEAAGRLSERSQLCCRGTWGIRSDTAEDREARPPACGRFEDHIGLRI